MATGHFMNLKGFHPSNFNNIKRVWIAEQKEQQREKQRQQMEQEYAKEKEDFLSEMSTAQTARDRQRLKESAGVSFLYRAPPGFQHTSKERQEDELEHKIQAMREARRGGASGAGLGEGEPASSTAEAPEQTQAQAPAHGRRARREADYALELDGLTDKPFGETLRRTKCIKCNQIGHSHVDRECPKFGKYEGPDEPNRLPFEDPVKLMEEMQKDGLRLKASALGYRTVNPADPNQQFVSEIEGEALQSVPEGEEKHRSKHKHKHKHRHRHEHRHEHRRGHKGSRSGSSSPERERKKRKRHRDRE